MRRPAVLALCALSLAVPAYAEKTVAGFNLGFAGSIVSRSHPGLRSDHADPAVNMLSRCDYAVVPAGAGTVLVRFGGSAQTVPLSPGETTATTSVRCEVNNFASGGTDVAIAEATVAGPNAVAEGTAVWPLRLITVCVTSGSTGTGGTVDNPRRCRPPDPVGVACDPGPGSGGRPVAFSFSGTATVPNFGSDAGGSDGTFAGSATGMFGGSAVSNACVTANFSYVEPNVTCPLIGTASGTANVGGFYIVNFTWQRIGATAVITTSDGGSFVAAFESAVTVPCPASGQHVTATVAGAGAAP